MSAYGNLPDSMVKLIAYGTLKRSRELAIARGKLPCEVPAQPQLEQFLVKKPAQSPADQQT